MTVLFKQVVKLPFPMTYKQIETSLHKSSPKNFIWRLPEDDGQVIGSQIQFANYGAEFFAKDDGVRLIDGETYSEIFVVSNEGFGGIIHAINDSPGHDKEVIEYCEMVVRDFLEACT